MWTHGAVDGAQRHEALHVVGEGAAVGVPVGVLSSLQDELLALEVMVLKTNPAVQKQSERERAVCFCFTQRTSSRGLRGKVQDLRSALHPDGADVVQSALLNVAALGGELQALALEVLLLEHGHLRGRDKT